MPGMRWETLPKSVPAAMVSGRTPAARGSRPRSRWERTQEVSRGPLSRTGTSLQYSEVRISMPVPVMRAAPWRTSSTRSAISLRVSRYFERTMMDSSVRSGMMLGTWPPSVMMAWRRSMGSICWRSRPMPVSARVAASRALRPMKGWEAAWAGTPWKMTRRRRTPSQVWWVTSWA